MNNACTATYTFKYVLSSNWRGFMSFLIYEGGYHTIVDNGVALKFSIMGKALEMTKFTPVFGGYNLQPVEVLSVLQQVGINQVEIGVNQNNQFSVIGKLFGDNIAPFIKYLDNDRNCIFIGRLNSKVSGISYQQTFYIYKQGFNFTDIKRMVQ